MNSISFLIILIIIGCTMINMTETSGTVGKLVKQTTESVTQPPSDYPTNPPINNTTVRSMPGGRGSPWDRVRLWFGPFGNIFGMDNQTNNKWRE
ncbi:unnamed protein product [Schistosoma spindalis]|nr:unnamed protein product [Schistosoma spindale]